MLVGNLQSLLLGVVSSCLPACLVSVVRPPFDFYRYLGTNFNKKYKMNIETRFLQCYMGPKEYTAVAFSTRTHHAKEMSSFLLGLSKYGTIACLWHLAISADSKRPQRIQM